MKKRENIFIARDPEELIGEFINTFLDFCNAAVASKGSFSISLSGGSTPGAIYRRLVGLPVEWSKIFFFFGDERFVPPDDAESNFRMATDAMLLPLGIKDENIFRWRTDFGNAAAAATDYSDRLRDFFGGWPKFDLCLLGLGADGHTASLFPETAALYETERIAAENWVPKFDSFRLTLTPPAINNSSNILFIVIGPEKAAAVASVIDGEYRPSILPAQLIKPKSGTLRWLIDDDAASRLLRG